MLHDATFTAQENTVDEDMHIPELMADFLNHASRIQLQEEALSRLRGLSISGEDYWNAPQRIPDFDSYRTEYLVERFAAQNTLVEMEELTYRVECFPVRSFHSARFTYFDGAFQLGTLSELYKTTTNIIAQKQARSARQELHSELKRLTRRLEILTVT